MVPRERVNRSGPGERDEEGKRKERTIEGRGERSETEKREGTH